MRELVIPDDGFVVKTERGRTVIDLSVQPDGITVRLFDADGEARIAFVTNGASGAAFIGDPDENSVAIGASNEMSELAVINTGRRLALRVSRSNGELRFINADDVTTARIYEDANGGQIGLADQRGGLAVSAGAGDSGGECCVVNTMGKTVVFLQSKEDGGGITLLDHGGDVRVLLDNNIHLVDQGRIVWTTMGPRGSEDR